MDNYEFAIRVSGLKKAYDEKDVLKGVTFKVQKGTIFCLLGSNGSGKTTTVKILATLLRMDSGTAFVGERDVNKDGAKVRKLISLTGQFTAVDEILTGRENLEMTARLCHIKDYKIQADKLLRDFHLEEAADKRTSAYSGGMRRRLDIAMSLLGNPSVIFLDEPTTGLDPQSRNAMWNIIEKLKENGVTIFLTTQYLEEAEELADRVAILHEGVIIANGTVEEIKKLSSGEIMIFTFKNGESIKKMREIFSEKITGVDEEDQTVTIEISGGMKQITNLFTSMEQHGIIPSSFTQKKATLEDVFLNLVDGEKENRR
ncbi:ATP-binding cassette domain-containing protein [uncultured Robinsoniella sp.]|uniref:ABC transporter ATP-binding protein n=1 Tax=uncultured Robinsoniella sp. TaxID=904190 RepID=UPI00374F92EB